MSKITCPFCEARVPLPKRRRPLSGPGPGRAYPSPLCLSCDIDLSEQIAEDQKLRRKRRLGLFAKGMVLCVVFCFLCILGAFIIMTLRAPRFDYNINPPWFDTAERGLMVFTEVFLGLGLLMKIGYKIFEEEP